MTAPGLLITFNAGSSTVKIGLFEIRDGIPSRIGKGMVDFRSEPLVLHLTEGPETLDLPLSRKATPDMRELIDEIFGALSAHFDMDRVKVAGHRVVHGGDRFEGAVRLDDVNIDAIEKLTDLAPLHQPQALRFIRAIHHLKPGLIQTASFDTAFHRTQDETRRRFAIPRRLHDLGVKRYGFHGLSYAYIARELQRLAPDVAGGKVVVAHLGSGASLCAIEGGASRDCSMGFSTLDGIPMATRPGTLDPGVLLHLLQTEGLSGDDIEDLLYHRSGLLGVSGFSADTRDLLVDGRPEAAEAIDLFTARIAGEVGRMAVTLGGLDALVFTAGIGEHQPQIRAGVAARLAWLGLEIDAGANGANACVISTNQSRIKAYVIPTDEEQVIATEALAVLCLD